MAIFDGLWTLGGFVVPFIFVLSLVVFFHELGHFMVGRWCGVKADVFSMGFGPELWARIDRHGTRAVAQVPDAENALALRGSVSGFFVFGLI